MRFSRNESPAEINAGDGWTEEKVADWLRDHDLHTDAMAFEDGYIRAKQFDAATLSGGQEIATGVLVMRGVRRDD